MVENIAVMGLGYVGLPVALAFAKKFPTVGFDIDAAKVKELISGHDRNLEVPESILKATKLKMTADTADLAAVTFWVVAVPTPVDENNVPDLTPVVRASEFVGKYLKKGDVVVYESTVYPGVTEDICGPVLTKVSGLARADFKLGYSPERINPGDKEHTLERITKVVSGEDADTLERVASTYGAIIDAGVHRAPSIKVAEAAKVIENTQRDINIALMNELALIFDRIGVDPYYLTTMAQRVGYHSEVILAGRRINDNMGRYVAQRLVKQLVNANIPVKGARVGVLGLTFKEDVNDIRNSKVPTIVEELKEFGVQVLLHDPHANAAETRHEYGLELNQLEEFRALDGLVLAVSHKPYLDMGVEKITACLRDGGVFMDVKSVFEPAQVGSRVRYWSL